MTRPDTPEYSSNAAMALSRPQLRRFYFDFRTDRHRCRSAGDRCRLKQTRKPPECTKYICCVQLKVEFYAMFIINFCALHTALITGNQRPTACHSHNRSLSLSSIKRLAPSSGRELRAVWKRPHCARVDREMIMSRQSSRSYTYNNRRSCLATAHCTGLLRYVHVHVQHAYHTLDDAGRVGDYDNLPSI